MKKEQYIKPIIDVTSVDFEGMVAASIPVSGGSDAGGEGAAAVPEYEGPHAWDW